MKITEIYPALQGEGSLVGTPILLIRMSGCQFRCDYCDSKFAWDDGEEVNVEKLVNMIQKSDKRTILWSGGEPLEQIKDITKIIRATNTKYHTLETNGSIHKFDRSLFKLITISPKTKQDAIYWYNQSDNNILIKVVTDLKTIGLDLIEFASMLMPLTTFNAKEDLEIKRQVWKYCVEHNIRYSPRLHVDLFGNRRKV